MRLAFTGGFGHHYLRQALSDRSVRVDLPVAYAPSGAEDATAQPLATVTSDIKLYPDLATLLKEFKPDVLSVGGVYGRNGDHIAAAFEAGVPAVITDKPAAATWDQLARLRRLTQADLMRVLITEFDFRSRPEFRAARDAVRAGKIGTPILATAQKSYRFATRPAWYADRASYGGTLLWVASHAIDAIWFGTGLRMTAVTGRHGNVSRPDYGSMEDHTATLMELENGATAIAHADYSRPDKAPTHGDDRLRIAGSEAVIEVRSGRCILLAPDGQEHDLTSSVAPPPMHADLLAAIAGQATDLYGTAAAFEIAEQLLLARDAADQHTWLKRGTADERG